MRVTFVVAMLAMTGTCGYAVAVPMLETQPLAPGALSLAEPLSSILVLDVAPSAAVAPDADEAIDLVSSAKRAVSLESPERLDHLPRFLLLPDGALVVALSTEHATLARGVSLRTMTAGSVIDAAPAPALPASKLDRLDQGVSTYERGTRTSAPAPAALPPAAVFQPSTTGGAGDARSYWAAGGLAAAGAAAAVGFALYHRIRPNAALENETRKTIFEAVCASPGLGVHEVSKLAGVSYSTATYHLERLVGAGMIVMTPDGNKLCYYKNGGAFTESERRILPLIKNEEAAKLFEAILQRPGTYRAALAEQLGVTATTINWHLRRLRDAGLVDETRQGRSAHLYAKIDALRPVFLALAVKVETTEPTTATKLRHYAHPGSPSGTSASA